MEEVEREKMPEVKEVVIIVAVGEEKVEEFEEIKNEMKTETTMKRHLCWLDVLVNAMVFIIAAAFLALTIWVSCQIPAKKGLTFLAVLMAAGFVWMAGVWIGHLIQITSAEKLLRDNRS